MDLHRKIKYVVGADGRTRAPWPSQKKFHLLPDRYKLFSGSTGSGKSLTLAHEAIRHAYLDPGLLGLIAAPTFPMLRDIAIRALIEILENSEIPYEHTKQDKHFYLPDCGSEIIYRSTDNPESLRGTNLAWFGIDELTYVAQEAFERLQARLRHPKAKHLGGCGVCTPRGFNWVYEKFVGPKKIYNAILAPPFENAVVVAQGTYAELARSYDRKFYAQEVLGEYLAVFAGQCYHSFERKVHVEPLAYDQRYPLCWALDFNVDRMSSVLAQILPQTPMKPRRIVVLDEIVLGDNSHTQDACSAMKIKIKELCRGQQIPVVVYGDASGANKAHAGPSDWEAVRSEFRSFQYAVLSFNLEKANPRVGDRVNTVNGLLRNNRGEQRIAMDPKCQELAIDFEQVAWKVGANDVETGEIQQTKTRSHISDAIGYMCCTEFPINQIQTGPSRQFIG